MSGSSALLLLLVVPNLVPLVPAALALVPVPLALVPVPLAPLPLPLRIAMPLVVAVVTLPDGMLSLYEATKADSSGKGSTSSKYTVGVYNIKNSTS